MDCVFIWQCWQLPFVTVRMMVGDWPHAQKHSLHNTNSACPSLPLFISFFLEHPPSFIDNPWERTACVAFFKRGPTSFSGCRSPGNRTVSMYIFLDRAKQSQRFLKSSVFGYLPVVVLHQYPTPTPPQSKGFSTIPLSSDDKCARAQSLQTSAGITASPSSPRLLLTPTILFSFFTSSPLPSQPFCLIPRKSVNVTCYTANRWLSDTTRHK